MPYKTAVGTTYDSGEFEVVMDKALELADYPGFNKRKRESAKRGKLRGIGFSCMLEHAGGAPLESAALLFPGGESAMLALNVQSTGQGHQTVFPRRCRRPARHRRRAYPSPAWRLPISTFPAWLRSASRSAITAGSAIVKTVDTMLAKGKTIAANVLEAAEADIDYRDGRFEVVGTDRRISLFELAEPRRRDASSAARFPKASTPRSAPKRRRPSPTAATSPRSRSIPIPAVSR